MSTPAKRFPHHPCWINDYMGDSMFKEVFQTSKTKDAHKDGIFSAYSLDEGNCGWRVRCAYQTPWPLEC